MRKASLSIVLFCLMASTYIYAGAGWTGPRNIVSIETVASGTEIVLEGFGGACTEIGPTGNLTWTKIDIANPNRQQHMAVLLMAFTTGKPVDIYCSSAAQSAPLDHIVVKN